MRARAHARVCVMVCVGVCACHVYFMYSATHYCVSSTIFYAGHFSNFAGFV